MNNHKIKYFYIRVKNPKSIPSHRGDPIACIAYEREADPDCPGEHIVTYALSAANPKDEFRKEMARYIARGRLVSGRTTVEGFTVEASEKNNQVIHTMLTLVACSDVPNRVRKAAVSWLESVKT